MGRGYVDDGSCEHMAEVEAEREMTRTEVATYLHEFADKLAGGASESRGESTSDPPPEEGTEDADAGADDTSTDARRVTFTVGNESATINPPETVRFEMAVDSTGGMLESGASETVSFALNWDSEETDDDGTLDIQ